MNNQDEKNVVEQAAASEKKAPDLVKILDTVCDPMGEFVWNLGEKIKNGALDLLRKGGYSCGLWSAYSRFCRQD